MRRKLPFRLSGGSGMIRFLVAFIAIVTVTATASAQGVKQTKGQFEDNFRQLEEVLPTPNVYRTGSGAPGHEYWQQRADYEMQVTLDEDAKTLTGSARITYYNNSPDTLRYIWVQLDQNRFARDSRAFMSGTGNSERLSFGGMRRNLVFEADRGGYEVRSVTDVRGDALAHTIDDTLMRIDLPQPLRPDSRIVFNIEWAYEIPEAKVVGARGGWEEYEDGNAVFFLSQFYPRVAAYTDNQGWHVKSFLGGGEFTLEFGDFEVEITAPADHVVASTGELQNPSEALTEIQRTRLIEAQGADDPVFVVTPEEAIANSEDRLPGMKTWRFAAENVRDFAFASSRKFVWDAMGYRDPADDRLIMAMSFYPEEGMPLWDKYSTHAVVHTLKTYPKLTFPYPYPVAISVMGPIGGGMEYPMITSNGPRPVLHEDGTRTYSRRAKYRLIGIVIHEIGHNWFPMVVDSDERMWTWMDEGLNSFLDAITQMEWEDDYPFLSGADPKLITDYMISENQVPVMTQSDAILQFGNNAYQKPATALNILRETILGRDLFDFAFREYANRWKFKRPYPADFFRTMEDASGRDLDWFWRGWFYSTDHVDISLDRVVQATIDTRDPDVEQARLRAEDAAQPLWPGGQFYADQPKYVDDRPELLDFYNEHDEFTVTEKMRRDYQDTIKSLEEWERELLDYEGFVYFLDFTNRGGLVMPILLEITYADGSTENLHIPAEIWRRNADTATKMLLRDKQITEVSVDPLRETADVNTHNNHWPRQAEETRLQLFKSKQQPSLMRQMQLDEAQAEEAESETGNGNDGN